MEVDLQMTAQSFVLDGVAGSGKSSVFGRTVIAAPDCLALPEINPGRAVAGHLSELGAVERAGWYLDRALAQLRAARNLSGRFPMQISDKGPLSVLAFSFALDGRSSAEYQAIERTYLQRIRHLCAGEEILILVATAEVSLERREQKREQKEASPWYDVNFLEDQLEFFRSVAPELHKGAKLIDTSEKTLHDTLGVVGDLLGIDLNAVTIGPPNVRDERFYPTTGYRVDDDAIWDFFSREGGSDFIGQPITPLENYQGRRVQFFERGAVERRERGVEHWDVVGWLEGGCS